MDRCLLLSDQRNECEFDGSTWAPPQPYQTQAPPPSGLLTTNSSSSSSTWVSSLCLITGKSKQLINYTHIYKHLPPRQKSTPHVEPTEPLTAHQPTNVDSPVLRTRDRSKCSGWVPDLKMHKAFPYWDTSSASPYFVPNSGQPSPRTINTKLITKDQIYSLILQR